MFPEILEKILFAKKKEVARKKLQLPLKTLQSQLSEIELPRDFRSSISNKEKINIIAEIKRRSPSAGILRRDLDPVQLAKLYEESGASAISVLIDKDFFGGSLEDLINVKKSTSLPLLAKEFILDEYQIFEARMGGADAILLIVRILKKEKLLHLYQVAHSLNLSCIVEIHSPQEIQKLNHLPPSIIVGINNRNLRNFKVDLTITERVLSLLPQGKLVISESGIKNARDIKMLRKIGVSAFLIGESILRSENSAYMLKKLCYGKE